MGIHRRYSAALLIFFSFSALATERVKIDPYIKAGPGYSAANGSITGYVPTKDNQTLLLEAERKGWLGSSSAKTPVTVKPKVSIPVGGISGKLKAGLKTNLGQIALGAAISGAIAGVGWVMSDDNTRIQKKSPDTFDGKAVLDATCVDLITTEAQVPGLGMCKSLNYWQYIQPGGTAGQSTSGWQYYSNVFVGSTWKYSISRRPRSVTDNVVPGTKEDLVDADWAKLDTYISGQGAAWLKDLLIATCGGTFGTLDPQGCYNDLQKQSAAMISGPTSVQGPTVTSTGTYTRADGTIGTTSSSSSTTYNIRYGDQYFDYDTVVTTTNSKDGQVTDSNTSTDSGTPQETPSEEKPEEEEQDYVVTDSELPKVDPFYEQQYPDGLQGVWDGKQAEFQDSAFVSFLHSFVPSFSGSCPAFSLSFAIAAWANYGTIQFSSICYALDLVKVVILVSALFLCRALIFGG